MNQRQVVLAVVAVGVVSVTWWVWHGNSQQPDVTPAPAKATALVPDTHAPPAVSAAPASEPAPVPAAAPVAPGPAAPDVDQNAASVRAPEPPASVDTPEPAERKFARGGRADESDQQN